MFLKSLYAAALAVAFTSAADAATTRFDFFYAPSNGGWEDELNFNVDGIGLTVSAGPGADAQVQHWKWHGLGVNSGSKYDSHQIDSWGPDDIVYLDFDTEVQVTKLKFSYVDDEDTFDFFVGGAEVLSGVDLPDGSSYASYTFGDAYIGTSFGIGAGQVCQQVFSNFKSSYTTCDKSAFKLKYVDVVVPEPIPLPATGLLLLAGLAGVGAIRRRA